MSTKPDPAPIGETVGRYKELSQEEAQRMRDESLQIAQWDSESRIRGAWKEGWIEGWDKGWKEVWEEMWEKGMKEYEKKGREEALLLVARNLLDAGQPVDLILKVTGLSREVVLSLTH